jgi:hypothetical protein
MNATATKVKQPIKKKNETPPVQVDQQALRELFWRKAPDLPELPAVKVRCDRDAGVWVIERGGGTCQKESHNACWRK